MNEKRVEEGGRERKLSLWHGLSKAQTTYRGSGATGPLQPLPYSKELGFYTLVPFIYWSKALPSIFWAEVPVLSLGKPCKADS